MVLFSKVPLLVMWTYDENGFCNFAAIIVVEEKCLLFKSS